MKGGPARRPGDQGDFDTAFSAFPARRWRDGVRDATTELVAEEVPVALEYNGVSHAVMLASPHDLDDFAIGFSLSEGIIDEASNIYDIELEEQADGITLKLTLSSRHFFNLKQHRRTLAGRTGCGLCGAESLEQVCRQPPPVSGHGRFAASTVLDALGTMSANQELMHLTGATHAAGWMDQHGCVTLVREDVGRHNALDKLIGALARSGADTGRGAALITSRASYEMVAKSAAAGIGLLAAISAPTGLAIRLAQSCNLTLAGFARDRQLVVYSHPERLNPLSTCETVT